MGFVRNIFSYTKYRKKVFVAKGVELKNCNIGEYSNFAHHAELRDCVIGKRTSVGRYTKIKLADIGAYCAISWDVTIGADAHPTDRVSGSAAFFQKRFGLVSKNISKGIVPRTIIGNDVLIGCKAIIKSGVSIGDGAIVGAGAVVVDDVEPYSIVVGVPAKKVGDRFEEDICSNLMQSRWWEWPEDLLKKNMNLFHSTMTKEVSEQLLSISKQ